MKKRIIGTIVGIFMTAGYAVYNYTGNDITLEDGTEIVSHDLQKSLTKVYRDRSIDDSLVIYIHHTAGSKSQTLQSISKYHVEQRGWPEIAYHVAINEDGDISLLNDIEEKTYHNSKDNTRGIGIVAVGNYENYKPSDELIESIKAVTDAMCQTLKIKAIKGHRDSKATACPGEYLYQKLKKEGVLMIQ